jgi:hypothetical protein
MIDNGGMSAMYHRSVNHRLWWGSWGNLLKDIGPV